MINRLDKKILLALSYTDQFQYPLTQTEIYLRLIGKDKVTKQQFVNSLTKLVNLHLVDTMANFYFLKNRQQLVKTRYRRYLISQAKWLRVKQFVSLVEKIPFVIAVAVTGSLSVDNAKQEADLDFLIVSKNNRTWLVRFILVVISWLKHTKRNWGKQQEKNSWCFNLWLEEDFLMVPKKLQSIYTAFEVCQTKWVLDRRGIKQSFFQDNSWVKIILPNFYKLKLDQEVFYSKQKQKILSKIGSYFFNLLNSFFYVIEYLYMKRHITLEVIDIHRAFFHPRKTKDIVYLNWFKRLAPLLLTKVLVTGVFDVLHQEHLKFLQKAKALGDYLVIGVESDKRVKQMKGNDRPINSERVRVKHLQSYKLANKVIVLPQKFNKPIDHLLFLVKHKPQYLAVSSHTAYLKQKRKLMELVGGEVKVVAKQNKNISTTKIINNVKNFV